ncbi:hypothetical protein A2739_00110 [Candidatus Giovannonibacteria bacterium RIFCSPHIGHO2_01_FULL_43_100]|nr:MAG: hypothetical protein A2739_00110 [Candidatus Giovannonibacteria bacterium RIFCSPHIGHO2_01_FULL_43_100]OGF78042.1 MAG: hypothetical protein A3A15_03535 [Candidatus Giovannonibacteria bacterium RIFCSPLOWO2_01_FULL_43_60]
MQNKRIQLGVVVVLVLAVLVVVLVKKPNNTNDYSVIYVSSGEVYVGKLTTFPSFELKNVYIYKVSKDLVDESKTNFQLIPVKDALWAPESMHFNRQNVIFYGALSPDSVIVKKLAEQVN